MLVDPAARIERICSEAEIRGVLTRYCRAVDRLDADLLRSVYWPDATDNHGSFFCGPAMDFVDFAIPVMRTATRRTMHLVCNISISIDADVAHSESYVYAYHLMRLDDAQANCVMGARYLDRLERRDSEWRIVDRNLVIDWCQNGDLLLAPEVMKTIMERDTRDRSDLSYLFLPASL